MFYCIGKYLSLEYLKIIKYKYLIKIYFEGKRKNINSFNKILPNENIKNLY